MLCNVDLLDKYLKILPFLSKSADFLNFLNFILNNLTNIIINCWIEFRFRHTNTHTNTPTHTHTQTHTHTLTHTRGDSSVLYQTSAVSHNCAVWLHSHTLKFFKVKQYPVASDRRAQIVDSCWYACQRRICCAGYHERCSIVSDYMHCIIIH